MKARDTIDSLRLCHFPPTQLEFSDCACHQRSKNTHTHTHTHTHTPTHPPTQKKKTIQKNYAKLLLE